MFLDRDPLDLSENVPTYWSECVTTEGQDIDVRHFLPCTPAVTERNKPVRVDSVSESTQKPDGMSLENPATEGVAKPLIAHLHRRMMLERERKTYGPRQHHFFTCKPEIAIAALDHDLDEVPACNRSATLGKLYPAIIPPDHLHPLDCDFSVIDQGPIGKALFTHRHWHKGDFMARFDGITVPKVMLHTLQKTGCTHLWDPYFIGNLAHSCNPNVVLDMAEHEMWAVQDIQPGTVLSMDYASTEDYLFRTFQCACNTSGCRGEVTGRKQRSSGHADVTTKSL